MILSDFAIDLSKVINSYLFLGFLVPALLIGLSGNLLVKILTGIGFLQHIREEAPERHKDKKNTPTGGGIVFLLGLVLCVIAVFSFINFSNFSNSLVKSNKSDLISCILFVCVSVFAGLTGFLDDYLKKVKGKNEGLKPKEKLLLQTILSFGFALCLGRTSTNFFGFELKLGIIIFLVFIFFVLAGSMNAVNLTDGLDGLCSSVLGLSFLGLGLLNNLTLSMPFHRSISAESFNLICFIMAGTCFGFFMINKKPAKAFMGDTGSFLLGGALSGLALLNGLEWFLLIVAFVPVIETLSVSAQILSCKLSKKFFGRDIRPFKMTPFHHHLELSGFSENKIVLILASVQALIIGLAVLIIYC